MKLTLPYVAVEGRRLRPAVLVLVYRRAFRARMRVIAPRWSSAPDLLRAARAWRP